MLELMLVLLVLSIVPFAEFRGCPGFSKPVKKGPSGSMARHAPSVSPSLVPQFSNFSAFLEDTNDDVDLGVEAVDPPAVSVVDDTVQRAHVACRVRLAHWSGRI